LGLEAYDALRLQAFGALADFKFDRLALVQIAVSIALDGRVVYEHVLARLALDESESLAGVEPLHSSLFFAHFCFLYFTLSYLPLIPPAVPAVILSPQTKGCKKFVLAAFVERVKKVCQE
jgi:hypothetical protein